MPIDEEVIDRARKFDVAAVTTIFAEYYPMVHRIAHALAGRPSVAREVERFVLKRRKRARGHSWTVSLDLSLSLAVVERKHDSAGS